MNDTIPEELISAYLDGELTSDEQVMVEQALQDNPQCQQLLEDLLSLRERLQTIPHREPSQDYTPLILRRAEETILTGSKPETPKPTHTNTAPSSFSQQNLKHLIWASTALAATVLLTLLLRSDSPSRVHLTDANPIDQAAPGAKVSNPGSNETGAEHSERDFIAEKSVEIEGDFSKGGEADDAPAELAADDAALSPKKDALRGFSAASTRGQETLDMNAQGGMQKQATSTQELVVYLNVSSKDFANQVIVRNLAQQQLAFDFNPDVTASDELSRSGAGALAEAEEESLEGNVVQKRKANPVNRNQNLVVLETSPTQLAKLLRDVTDQHAVQISLQPGMVQRKEQDNQKAIKEITQVASAVLNSAPATTLLGGEGQVESKIKFKQSLAAAPAGARVPRAAKPQDKQTNASLLSDNPGTIAQKTDLPTVRIILVIQSQPTAPKEPER